jgi:glycerol uptake facilitator-like aquaporin
LLLAVVIGSGIMAERLSGGNLAIALLANTVATMAGLYVLIEVFAPISGAHFNPAVSLVMAARGALPPSLLAPMCWPSCWAPCSVPGWRTSCST